MQSAGEIASSEQADLYYLRGPREGILPCLSGGYLVDAEKAQC